MRRTRKYSNSYFEFLMLQINEKEQEKNDQRHDDEIDILSKYKDLLEIANY